MYPLDLADHLPQLDLSTPEGLVVLWVLLALGFLLILRSPR